MPSSNFKTALIVGASGGIGKALIERLSHNDSVENLIACSRSTQKFDLEIVQSFQMDITDEASIYSVAQSVKDSGLRPDLMIVATGLLHNESLQPEKSIRDLSADKFERLFAVNTIGPMMVAKHFLPLMPRDARSVFAALSARVGSISDNRLGGWYAYRASKAALNMGLKNLAIETARRKPEAIIVGLHPGTTDTDLSKPFQANVADGKLFSPDFVAERLLSVLDSLDVSDTGKIFDWAGDLIKP